MSIYKEIDAELSGLYPKTELSRNYLKQQEIKKAAELLTAQRFTEARAKLAEEAKAEGWSDAGLIGAYQAARDLWRDDWPEGTTFEENYKDLHDAADGGNEEAIKLLIMVDYVYTYGKDKKSQSTDSSGLPF